MLPSTLLTVSASASFEISWLNSTPHCIAVYASQPPSPTTTQHSLAGARYGLPAPVFHRLDRASFSWRTSNLDAVIDDENTEAPAAPGVICDGYFWAPACFVIKSRR